MTALWNFAVDAAALALSACGAAPAPTAAVLPVIGAALPIPLK